MGLAFQTCNAPWVLKSMTLNTMAVDGLYRFVLQSSWALFAMSRCVDGLLIDDVWQEQKSKYTSIQTPKILKSE